MYVRFVSKTSFRVVGFETLWFDCDMDIEYVKLWCEYKITKQFEYNLWYKCCIITVCNVAVV